ncbi:hypothetical protein F4808DRAFT_270922 [Astrocystis sublimbata]|nr:hypothetical protein F4808DRAFT_270922 [Astrocystis sublimbata]
MSSTMQNLIYNLTTSPEQRYLDAATRETVCTDLEKLLVEEKFHPWQERERLRAIFSKHAIAIGEKAEERLWDESSFRNFIRATHPASTIPEPHIQLLWRCFSFYARHPFPIQFEENTITLSQFQRGVLLTAYQCDAYLGTRDGLQYYARDDGVEHARRAGFARLFSSIAGSAVATLETQEQKADAFGAAVEDCMDVLAMLGPQRIHHSPSTQTLKAAAQRLCGEDGMQHAVCRSSSVEREQLSLLLDLLLRLRLGDKMWGLGALSTGCFADTGDAGMVKALGDYLAGSDEGRKITVKKMSQVEKQLPNLMLRFQQLWQVLFQPPQTQSTTTVEATEDAGMSAALSLFAPEIDPDITRKSDRDRGTRLVLQEAGSQSQSGSISRRLAQALTNPESSYVVVFSTGPNVTPRIVNGAYVPAPSSPPTVGTQTFFQLQPTFRQLRWRKGGTSLFDSIKAAGPDDALHWIGDGTGLGAGLRVDSAANTITLSYSAESSFVEVVGFGGEGEPGESWEVTIHDPRLYFYIVK